MFIGATVIVSAFFLYMTVLSPSSFPSRANTARLTEEVVWGKKVWGKHACIDCHTLLPEEVEGEIYSVKLAWLHFWMFLVGGATAIVGYLFRWHDGREFLEQPFLIKVAIVMVVLMFIFNMVMTMIKGRRRTSITIVLLIGFPGLALFYLFAFFKPDNMVMDKYFWW